MSADGWTWEYPDPSMRFGGAWVHELCPATDTPQPGIVDDDAQTITCPHCGAVTR